MAFSEDIRDALLMVLFPEDDITEAIRKVNEYSMLASSDGEQANCRPDKNLQILEEDLKFILQKTDHVQNFLVPREVAAQNELFTNAVPSFLKLCQPYFKCLESTARNTPTNQSPLTPYARTQLLQFSEQLCSRLEQVILSFAANGYVSLDETDPMGVSHFYIGQCQVDNIKFSIFRYCQPTPFLAFFNTGVYKHMRWTVERTNRIEAGREEEKNEIRTEVTQAIKQEEAEREGKPEVNSAEYYFLCHEDIHLGQEESLRGQTDRMPEANLRMWSIGKWVQIYPDPETEDINDWILCTIPQAQYKPLVYLDEEPSNSVATDYLLGVLLADQPVTPTTPPHM